MMVSIKPPTAMNSTAKPFMMVNGANPTVPSRLPVEKSYTIKEVASMYSWSYLTTYRYFRDLPGILVKVNDNQFRKLKRFIRIPESVVEREWLKLTSYNDPIAA